MPFLFVTIISLRKGIEKLVHRSVPSSSRTYQSAEIMASRSAAHLPQAANCSIGEGKPMPPLRAIALSGKASPFLLFELSLSRRNGTGQNSVSATYLERAVNRQPGYRPGDPKRRNPINRNRINITIAKDCQIVTHKLHST